MSKEQFEKIINHQVVLDLKDKGLTIKDLKDIEYIKLKYEVALQLLCELGK